jgi:hypothetical protein
MKYGGKRMALCVDVGAASFALLAAVFWFISAYEKLPPMNGYWDSVPDNDAFYLAVKFSAEQQA